MDRIAEKHPLMEAPTIHVDGARAPVIVDESVLESDAEKKLENADTELNDDPVQGETEGRLMEGGVEEQEEHIDTQVKEDDEKEEEAHDDDVLERMTSAEKDAEETDTASESIVTAEKEEAVSNESLTASGNTAEKVGVVEDESASSKVGTTETGSNILGNVGNTDSLDTVEKDDTAIGETRSETGTPAENEIGIGSETLRDELTTADKAEAGNDETKDEDLTTFDKEDTTTSETANEEMETSGKEENVNGENTEDLSPSDKERIAAGDINSEGLQVADKDTVESDTARNTATEGVDATERAEAEEHVNSPSTKEEVETAADKSSIEDNMDGVMDTTMKEEEVEGVTDATIGTAEKSSSGSPEEKENTVLDGSRTFDSEETSSDLTKEGGLLDRSDKQEQNGVFERSTDETLDSGDKMATTETDTELSRSEFDGIGSGDDVKEDGLRLPIGEREENESFNGDEEDDASGDYNLVH